MAIKAVIRGAQHFLREEHPKATQRRLLAGAGALAVAWLLLGGQQGLFALAMSQREKARLREDIIQLKVDNAKLEAQADALARDPEASEKTARERLLLMRPGEIIYRFQ
jgi:cell division protein FtsB